LLTSSPIQATTEGTISYETQNDKFILFTVSVGEGIDSSGDIKHESGRDQDDHGGDGVHGGLASAGEHTEADLDDVDHGQHQEEAAHDGPNGGAQHAQPQGLQVDVGPKGLVGVLAVEQVERQLEPLRHQRGAKEEAKRHHFEDQELLGYVGAGVARRAALEAALPRRGEGEPHKDGDREEGVHVDQAVQGRDVDAGGGGGGRGRHPSGHSIVRVILLRVLL